MPFCFDSHKSWNFERAPEPNDIFWENLGVKKSELLLRRIISYFLIFSLIFGAIYGIISIK